MTNPAKTLPRVALAGGATPTTCAALADRLAPISRVAVTRRAVLALTLTPPIVAQAQPPPVVVASFSILGDFVRQLAPGASLRVLLPPEADPHDVAPRPADAVALRGAALVVRNGLGLEPWLDRLLRGSPLRGALVTASDGWPPRLVNGLADPHAWLDPLAARHYARRIGSALASAVPAQALLIEAATAGYLDQLAALDAWVATQFASVPAERRVFVTGHAGFGYYAARYGLEALAAPPQRSGQLAALLRQVRSRRLLALFTTGPEDAGLMRRVAAEAGVTLRGRLYAETLSPPDGPAADYLALMRHNTALLVAGMLA